MHLPNRDQAVDQLASKVGKLTDRHRRELRHLLGNPPRAENVPASFWADVQREMEEELAAALMLLFLAAVDSHGGDVSVAEAAGAIHASERASVQGQRYRSSLQGRLDTLLGDFRSDAVGTGDGLAGKIGSAGYDATRTATVDLGPLFQDLDQTFDAQAERIAASETTNAETAGGDAAQVIKYGDVSQDDIWRAHPSRTKTGSCNRCKRLDGTKRKVWGQIDEEAAGGPMLHEHCACTIDYAVQGETTKNPA